jgi:glycosyltransferase involved in cell wall biosynthesis
MPDVVFLYSEIAGYFLACCKELSEEYNIKVHVVRYPVNQEAPFTFEKTKENIILYNRRDYSYKQLENLLEAINPGIIICSGWIDKDYLRICKKYYGKTPTVLTLDTHWRGDLKQKIATFISPFYLKKRFSHAWVPGTIQKKYALKLGFKEEQIRLGFYSCDVNYFSSLYDKINKYKKQSAPNRFIYVGRYYDFKGITDLWNAFIELQNEYPSDWELWCMGTGTLTPVIHPKIKHLGFVQPTDFFNYVKDTSVFVLPSLFEPWGVVLHEFATMGFPLIVSDKTGAAEAFMEPGKNGFVFESGNTSSLKEKLKTMMQMPPENLTLMGEHSRKLALKITPATWSYTLMTIK